MLLHISLHGIRTEGLLKLSSRSSICNCLPNSTLSLLKRFFTLKLPPLFLLSFPIQEILKRSFRLCVFLMQWPVVLESMEKPVCKLCFPTLLSQPPADAFPDKPSSVRGSLTIRVGGLCQLQPPSVELVSVLKPLVLLQPVSPELWTNLSVGIVWKFKWQIKDA